MLLALGHLSLSKWRKVIAGHVDRSGTQESPGLGFQFSRAGWGVFVFLISAQYSGPQKKSWEVGLVALPRSWGVEGSGPATCGGERPCSPNHTVSIISCILSLHKHSLFISTWVLMGIFFSVNYTGRHRKKYLKKHKQHNFRMEKSLEFTDWFKSANLSQKELRSWIACCLLEGYVISLKWLVWINIAQFHWLPIAYWAGAALRPFREWLA